MVNVINDSEKGELRLPFFMDTTLKHFCYLIKQTYEDNTHQRRKKLG